MAVTNIPTDALAAASAYANAAAPSGLTGFQARLYSHITRLRANDTGIRWTEHDTKRALHEALGLVEVGRIERVTGQLRWHDRVRRAAEILEWLSEPRLTEGSSPLISLLSAG